MEILKSLNMAGLDPATQPPRVGAANKCSHEFS
jgi:hypothetical protein